MSVMTAGEELGGNVNNQTMMLRLFLFSMLFVSLTSGCNQSHDEIKHEISSYSKAIFVADVYETCGDILFAALYHLPATENFFEDRKDLMGQPANFFSDLLSQETKENILIQLTQIYKQSDRNDELETLNRSLNQWCEAYQTIQRLQNQSSYEEFLAKLLESEGFKYLFYPHIESSIFQNSELSAFEKVASFSSAQSQNIVTTLTTDLAIKSPPQFEIEMTALKVLYES